MATEITGEIEALRRRAAGIASAHGAAAVRPTHLALAIMSSWGSPWPDLILERGGLAYESAGRRLGRKATTGPGTKRRDRPHFRSSMRLTFGIAIAGAIASLTVIARRMVAPRGGRELPPFSRDSIEVVRLAGIFAAAQGGRPRPHTGHVLLALTSRPGEHLKVLPNPTVLACDLRVRLGLATTRHRLILACDRLGLIARRTHMRIDRELATRGHRSWWGVAWVLYGAPGSAFAILIFPVTVLASALLYSFLWPAALLMAGARALCGKIIGCEARSYHWLKVPGGDVEITPGPKPASPRAVTAALLVPRAFAALICVAVLSVLFWRLKDVGVVIAPVVLRRPDLITGGAPEAFWLGPFSVFFDMLEHNGTAAGIGLLAGLGAGVMSIPSFREVELIRLYAGHEAGGGSRFARAITAPASVFTSAISCVEAVLPFTGAPLYATAYVVPLFFSALMAIAVLQLAPY